MPIEYNYFSFRTYVSDIIYTYFEEVLKGGDLEDIADYYDRFHIDIRKTDAIILHEDYSKEVIDWVIAKGADVHEDDESLLAQYCLRGDIDMVKHLIETYNCDYNHMFRTNAYNNHDATKAYLDTLPRRNRESLQNGSQT
jgi:hypothetical protein